MLDRVAVLRSATWIFAVALVVHGADHLRRGYGLETSTVLAAGTAQLIIAIVTIVLVLEKHRWAPVFAIGIGFASAIGFTLAHLCPDWLGPVSDSFLHASPARRVNAFSWFAAVFEITADLAVGVAGLLAVHAWSTIERPVGASRG